MAKYTVTHLCGCTCEVQLFGKMEERERKLQWLAGKPCAECARKAAAERAAKEGLPFRAYPVAEISAVGFSLFAEVRGNTFDYRDILREKGYGWNSACWRRKVADVKWGDSLPAELAKGVDGMAWDGSVLCALKNAFHLFNTTAGKLVATCRDKVQATINSCKQ